MSYRCDRCHSKKDCHCDKDPNELVERIEELEEKLAEKNKEYTESKERLREAEFLLKRAAEKLDGIYPLSDINEFLSEDKSSYKRRS